MKYIVYERNDKNKVTGVDVICQIDENGNFSGSQADSIHQLLTRLGYPEKDPTWCLHGGYCWAAEDVEESPISKAEKPKTAQHVEKKPDVVVDPITGEYSWGEGWDEDEDFFVNKDSKDEVLDFDAFNAIVR
jgi:hypothetical protein